MFVQCKIILEGTLIVSNLKMINKMSTFPPAITNVINKLLWVLQTIPNDN